jgi:UDP-N-acetyl-2-amino-2-deoxyglucuronate dehydrogenase
MKRIRVGIVGAGFMGRTNAETASRYLQNAELVAVAGGTRAPALAAEYQVRCEPSVESLLKAGDIDAVLISTPHSEHCSQAVMAASNGKHVLLDKPMAASVEECDRILEAAQKAGVILMMMHAQRFRICNQEARQLICEDAIGKVGMIEELILASGGLQSLPPWQSQPKNVGTFLGHAVHNIDRIRWFTGSEIVSVAAQVQHDSRSGNEVSTMAVFGLNSGCMATLWESWDIPAPGFPQTASSARIVGEKGILELDAYGQLRLGRDGTWTVVAEQTPIDWRGEGMLSPVRMKAYQAQHQEFIDSVLEDRQPSVNGEDGRATVAVAEAVYQSARESKTIRLSAR